MLQEEIKDRLGAAAAQLVSPNMIVGLGSGTTASFFIHHLAQRCLNGLSIQAVASSVDSFKLAQEKHIPLLDINTLISIDLTVDGADEVDPQKRMIKGAGGALLREKIMAYMSLDMIVLIDSSKLSPSLGQKKLPIEILPFAMKATEHHLQLQGFSGTWRKTKNGALFLTDNGNAIFDADIAGKDPEKSHRAILSIPGSLKQVFFSI